MSNKTEIILHHSATADGAVLKDFDAIRKYHIQHNGWRDIGYHYVVELVEGQFKALHGRSESDEGAHCIDHNKKSIGVCCVGNFELTQPPEELYYVVAELCRDIMSRHPIERICAHKDFSATACPGRFFDVEKIKRMVNQAGGPEIIEVNIIKNMKVKAVLINGETYVHLRNFVAAMNGVVDWDADKRQAVVM